jgi:hypothetical protein
MPLEHIFSLETIWFRKVWKKKKKNVISLTDRTGIIIEIYSDSASVDGVHVARNDGGNARFAGTITVHRRWLLLRFYRYHCIYGIHVLYYARMP